MYDYAYVSPPCFSLSLQWKQIDFVVLCNLLCQSHSSSWESSLLTLFWITLNQEFSLFLKSVNWQMFLYRPCCHTEQRERCFSQFNLPRNWFFTIWFKLWAIDSSFINLFWKITQVKDTVLYCFYFTCKGGNYLGENIMKNGFRR